MPRPPLCLGGGGTPHPDDVRLLAARIPAARRVARRGPERARACPRRGVAAVMAARSPAELAALRLAPDDEQLDQLAGGAVGLAAARTPPAGCARVAPAPVSGAAAAAVGGLGAQTGRAPCGGRPP